MNSYNKFAFQLTLYTTILLILTVINSSQARSVVQTDCRQLILVITESIDRPEAILYRFERNSESDQWGSHKKEFPVIVGKNGLGWTDEILLAKVSSGVLKKEGDGRSPAGIMNLAAAFGFKTSAEAGMHDYPYLGITEMTECIDDPGSKYYNTILMKDEADTIDWQSSEKMRRAAPWYEWGVVINHNTEPCLPGAGSCIFLHNWAAPDDSTVGCTAMDPDNMLNIIRWLNREKAPVLVQLDRISYQKLKDEWNLPDINLGIREIVSPGVMH